MPAHNARSSAEGNGPSVAAESAPAGFSAAPSGAACTSSPSLFLRGEVFEHALLTPPRGGQWGVEGVCSYIQAFAKHVGETRRVARKRADFFVALEDWLAFNKAWGSPLGAAGDLASSVLAQPRLLSASQSCASSPLDEEEIHVFWHLFLAVLKVYGASLQPRKADDALSPAPTASSAWCRPRRPPGDPETGAAAEGRQEASRNLRTLTFLSAEESNELALLEMSCSFSFSALLRPSSSCSVSARSSEADGARSDDIFERSCSLPSRASSSAPAALTALDNSLAAAQSGERMDLRALALLLLIQESRIVRAPWNPRTTDDPWRAAPPAGLADGSREASGGTSPAVSALASGGARGESPRYASRETGPQGVADESRLRAFLHQALPALLQTVAACTRELRGRRAREEDEEPGADEWISGAEADVFSLLFACVEGWSVGEAFSGRVFAAHAEADKKERIQRSVFLSWMRRRLVWNDRLYPSRQSLPASSAFFSASTSRLSQFSRVLLVSEAHDRRLTIDEESLGTLNPRDQVLFVNCSECDIFLDAPVSAVKLVNCSNLSLICGRPVGGMVSLYNTQRLEVHAVTFLLQACNTLDAQLFVCSASPPLLCGDTRGIVLAPFDAPLALRDLRKKPTAAEGEPQAASTEESRREESEAAVQEAEEELEIFGRPLSAAATAFAFPLCGGGCGLSSALSASASGASCAAEQTRCTSAGARAAAGSSHIFELLNPKNFTPISLPRASRPPPECRGSSTTSQGDLASSFAPQKQKLDADTACVNDAEEDSREESLFALPEDFTDALFDKQEEVASLQEAMENVNLTESQRETFLQILALMLHDFCKRHSRRTRRLATGQFARHEEVLRSREASTGSIC
ncbi:hypothetical protein BESB_069310 [Besnoitia besnoiti]|uniref:C-CAP/cofactor C-like domain-containing protein n=1 Tax=Besnoitia besnoiti TaxID=94643 RepID=A0A2A9M8T9_BESBE|nr:hypothetical protein BESB_069310 [Besnoitia besnoiti]PFH34898.1 hypothetical protein BESB_069310 [Besnoitia besnoiti]